MKRDLYIRTMRAVDLSTDDYEGIEDYANMGMFFGVYLLIESTLKVVNQDGATETLTLGPGYHPGQFSKIFANGDGTNVDDVIIWY
jgi:hypothetical protein